MWSKSYNETDHHKRLLAMSSQEFDEYMCKTYTSQFAQRNMPMTETCMCWGFEVGKGWYPLLDEMCARIQLIIDKYPIDVQFAQIKSKYGSGRFYYDSRFKNEDLKEDSKEYADATTAYELIGIIVSYAEEISDNICSETGVWYSDKITTGYWVEDASPEALKAMDPERYTDSVDKCVKRNKLIGQIKSISYKISIEKLESLIEQLYNKQNENSN